MNLLTDALPVAVWCVGDELYFDVDAPSEADEVFDIAASFGSVLSIFAMLGSQTLGLTENEKKIAMLRMFYLDNVPYDVARAAELMNDFIDHDTTEPTPQAKKVKPLTNWEQDGNYIYAAVNQSFAGILDREPDLHWWKFQAYLASISEDCRIHEIVNNRLAHRNGKATKEQKEARRLYPEIYVLREARKSDGATVNRAKELERRMNTSR